MMQSYNNYSPRNRDFCTKLQTNLKIFSKVLYFNVVENLALYVGNGIKRDFGFVGKGKEIETVLNFLYSTLHGDIFTAGFPAVRLKESDG